MSGRWTSPSRLGAEPASSPAAATTASAQPAKRGGIGPVLAVVGIGVAIYTLSPGARYYYRHGRLPAS